MMHAAVQQRVPAISVTNSTTAGRKENGGYRPESAHLPTERGRKQMSPGSGPASLIKAGRRQEEKQRGLDKQDTAVSASKARGGSLRPARGWKAVVHTREVKSLEGNRQLVIWTKARHQGGEDLMLQALIDTGAEANLIRFGILPSHCMMESKNPIALITADGTHMRGGRREVALQLCFSTMPMGRKRSTSWCTQATFYEADIGADINLSYPWLEQAHL